MLNYIEGLLEKKTKGSSSDILYTQWSAAKNYIFQVLEIVTHTFPHYSMHDKTHADTILKNIVRILGRKTIEEQFTSIDLWLLLMAAYYHDCGMAVFSTEKIEAFKKDSEFVKYILLIKEDSNSPLNEYAQYLEIIDNTLYHKNKELTAKSYEAAKFLLADFIRKEHSSRSASSIHSNSSLHLPGNPIPERLIYWLSEICRVHTCPFEDVMKLPFAENGYDDDDCHPRYIACLLRIGDLLDIDNNRISEVLLSTLGAIPYDSLLHKHKTASIRRLEINTKEISISAECDSYEVADISNKWFDWINEEFTNQLKNWNNIVPNSNYGYLPTVGELNVILKNFDLFDGKSRPHFSINSQKAIELLQGAGLYKDPCQSIRELLQNATDATYLRLWKESRKSITDFNSFKVLCQNVKILIKLTFIEFDGDNSIWEIRIIDQGIGMSKSDLQYLAQTGSSNKNAEKTELIKNMPNWMQPSGVFGIGFQSVFLLTDQVILNTKKIYKENDLHVVLNNPTSNKEGSILVQTNRNDDFSYGTELIFKIRISNSLSWTIGGGEFNATRYVNTFDFAVNKFLYVTIGKIQDEVIKFAQYSMIPIIMVMDDVSYELSRNNIDNSKSNFYADLGIDIFLDRATSNGHLHLFYRNQPVEFKNFRICFWNVSINILKDNASKVLTLNRNEIKSEYKSKLRITIKTAILRELLKKYDDFEGDQKYFASMFYEMNKKYLLDDMNNYNYSPSWGDYIISYTDLVSNLINNITIKDLFENYSSIQVIDSNWNKSLIFYDDNKKIKIINEQIGYDVFMFLCFIINTKYNYIEYTSDGIQIRKNSTQKVFISDFKSWFRNYMNSSHYARALMPCHPNYTDLAVSNIDWYDSTFEDFNIEYPVMICPYIRKYKDNHHFSSCYKLEYNVPDEVVELTYKNSVNKSKSKEEIKDLYNKFCMEYGEIINQINEERNIKKIN